MVKQCFTVDIGKNAIKKGKFVEKEEYLEEYDPQEGNKELTNRARNRTRISHGRRRSTM